MRMKWTYRWMYRNAAHDNDGCFWWKRHPVAAAHANTVALLANRAAQCASARQVILNFIDINIFTMSFDNVNALLTAFWQRQKFTRVVSRILRELAKPQHPCIMFR